MHQDLVFLHYQEKIISTRRQDKWLNAVYTPNPQDKMVIALRQWLEQKAGGGIPWADGCKELPAAERDKQKLFDVWTTHTQNCRVCQSALKTINRLTVLSYLAAIVCLIVGVIADARAVAVKTALVSVGQTTTSGLSFIPPAEFWWAMGGAILLATVGYLLNKFSRLFYVYHFEHSHND